METKRHDELLDAVQNRFALLAGLEREEAASWSDLSALALDGLLPKMQKEPQPEEAAWDLLVFAAGAVANYRYALATFTQAGKISIADLSVDGGEAGRVESARLLMTSCLDELSPLVRDEYFIFREV